MSDHNRGRPGGQLREARLVTARRPAVRGGQECLRPDRQGRADQVILRWRAAVCPGSQPGGGQFGTTPAANRPMALSAIRAAMADLSRTQNGTAPGERAVMSTRPNIGWSSSAPPCSLTDTAPGRRPQSWSEVTVTPRPMRSGTCCG